MKKKLQPYLFLVIFFGAILLIFRFSSTFVDDRLASPDIYLSHVINQNQLKVKTTRGFYDIAFINNHIAEVSFYNDALPRVDTSYAVVQNRDDRPISFSEQADFLSFHNDDFEVGIQKQPFNIFFIQAGDTLLRQAGGFFDYDTLKGFNFQIKPDENIYGAGFRTTPGNRRNQHFELYNQPQYGYSLDAPNLNFSVPFVLSNAGYGLLFDNVQKGILDIDVMRQNRMTFGSIGGRMAYYVVGGTNSDSILSRYAQLTGLQPMPPRWALGNIQSRFGYKTQAEAEEVVDKMLEADFPLDALVIDLYWFGEGVHDSFYMGDLEWYRKNWPSPAEMIAQFKKKNVKTILITEPFILKKSKYYDTLSQAGLLGKNSAGDSYELTDFWFGPGGLFDIFKPEMQDWFWEKYQAQAEIGVAGWWGDLGEPEVHPEDMIHANGSAPEVHNIYGHYWHKMLWERYAQHYPDVRLFNLNRSGFAGSQRYAIFPWSGDVSRSWAGLQAQPLAVSGMTLSGFSYMHSDLGGFAGGAKDEELYLRWLQYGTFNPVFRVHGDSKAPVEPYLYSPEAQKILRRFINLRYQMLPYNYTLAWQNASKGLPITRPLFFDESDNKELANIDDTYLWGPNILVAPILEKGQKQRKIFLPDGLWYDFFTDEKVQGGQWIEKEVHLETIPVFARGGSFIPMIDPIANTENYSSKKLIIHYYLDDDNGEATFTMYEDDGKTKDAVAKNLYEFLHFKARNFEDMILISLERDIKGKYEGMPANRDIELVIHGMEQRPASVQIGKPPKKATPNFIYDDATGVMKIKLDWDTPKIRVQIEMR